MKNDWISRLYAKEKYSYYKESANMIDFNMYQELASRTAKANMSKNQALANWSMGLTGEAGETVDYLKKVVFHGHELNREHVKKELGDVLWYVSQLASECGISLQEIADANIEKLRARYPEGFSSDRSVNREE